MAVEARVVLMKPEQPELVEDRNATTGVAKKLKDTRGAEKNDFLNVFPTFPPILKQLRHFIL